MPSRSETILSTTTLGVSRRRPQPDTLGALHRKGFFGALPDQPPLELSEAAEDVGHHFARRRRRVNAKVKGNERPTLTASTHTAPSDPVFISSQGTRQTPSNVGRRLKTAIKDANPILEEKGIEPINERVSPHSLRRTYASLRYACGDDPVFVAEQGGRADPASPIKVYARAVKRREKPTGEYREAFDAAIDWGRIGTRDENAPSRAEEDNQGRTQETAS